jgi:hypothetical protein
MTTIGNLWVIGYNGTERAAQVRQEIGRLADRHCLVTRESSE